MPHLTMSRLLLSIILASVFQKCAPEPRPSVIPARSSSDQGAKSTLEDDDDPLKDRDDIGSGAVDGDDDETGSDPDGEDDRSETIEPSHPREGEIQVASILKEKCTPCHGDNGTAKGGLGDVTQVATLIERKIIIPGDTESIFVQRLDSGMPPAGSPSLTAEEKNAIVEWVEQGASAFSTNDEATRVFYPIETGQRLAAVGIEESGDLDRRFFSLVEAYNSGASEESLNTMRRALTKVLNSLSQNPQLVVPLALDDQKLFFQIKLSDYGWSRDTWDQIVSSYRYTFLPKESGFLAKLQQQTGSPVPIMRVDWFIHNATVPPLYYNILSIPNQIEGFLQTIMGVEDLGSEIRAGRVVRAGFNNSQVTRNHRVIERLSRRGVTYWRSYEFGTTSGKQDIFSNPLGPEKFMSNAELGGFTRKGFGAPAESNQAAFREGGGANTFTPYPMACWPSL